MKTKGKYRLLKRVLKEAGVPYLFMFRKSVNCQNKITVVSIVEEGAEEKITEAGGNYHMLLNEIAEVVLAFHEAEAERIAAMRFYKRWAYKGYYFGKEILCF